MAFTFKGPIVAGAREATGPQSVTLTTGYAIGDVVVVWAATKATGTSGSSTEVTVTDTGGNSYVRALEYFSGGTVGTRASVHYANVTTALVSGNTVTIGISSGLSQFQGMAVGGFTIGAGQHATHAAATGFAPASGTAAISGSLAGLAAADYLFLATVANRNSTVPANFTGNPAEGWALTGAVASTGTTGGTTASGQHVNWNYKISSGASSARYNASGLIAGGARAIVVVALKEEPEVHVIQRPYYSLLLHCDGADGTTSFIDMGNHAHSVSVNAQAQVDIAQSKFGGASLLLDGTSDSLQLDGSDDFAFADEDFTVDFWIRLNATGSSQNLYDSRPGGGQGAYPAIYVSNTNILNLFVNNTNQITGTTALTTGQWYHIALARSGTSTKLFLDGTQEGSTYSDSNTYDNGGSGRPVIGAQASALGTEALNGWIDEIRVIKGAAIWTSNFTPPTAPYNPPSLFGGDSTLSALLTTPSVAHQGAATFVGAGSLSALAENPKIGEASFAGAGTLQTYANLSEQIAATLNGTSTLFVQYFAADIQGGLGYWFNGVPFVGLVGQNTDTRGLKYWFNGIPARYLLGEEVAGVHQGEARFNGAGSLSVLATLNEAAATTQNGAGALSITANLNEAAAATFNGDSTLSALAVFSTVTHQGAATFNGNSTLSVETQKSKTAEATFNGDSTLTIATAKSKQAEATFSGAGDLSVTARLNERAAATLSGSSTLLTYANLNERAAATLNGDSTLSALAVFSGAVQQGAATFNGNSTLSVLAENPKIGAATFPGAGSLSAAVTLGEAAAATLNGDSTLSIATQKSKTAEAVFNGTSSLSVLARLVQPAFATYAGQGTLSALATLNERASAIFNGGSTLSANAEKAGQHTGEATFNGAGNLSITARLNERAAATLDGAGSLSITVVQVDRAAATFNGSSTLSVTASKHIAATFNGAGSLSAQAQQQKRVDIVLMGASTLRVEAQLIQSAAANLNGASDLSILMAGGLAPRVTTSQRGAGRYGNRAQTGRSNLATGKRVA